MIKHLNCLLEPQVVMWILIGLIVIISKFGVGLNYISVMDIIKNHMNCFRNKTGKILLIPIINYIILPFVMGAATMEIKEINDKSINSSFPVTGLSYVKNMQILLGWIV